MFKRLYNYIEVNYLIGRKKYQPFFESLHRVALRGMNYGQNDSIQTNGEKWLLSELSAFFKHQGEISPIIFDVGANKGQYAEIVLATAGRNAQLFSFEPSPFAFDILAKKFAAIDNVSLFNLGFGREDAQLPLYFNSEGSTLASLNPIRMEDSDEKHAVTVRISTIDSFCRSHEIKRINFLKMDIEGHELPALYGAREMLATKCVDIIQFEIGHNNIQSRVYLFDFFKTLNNYTMYRLLKDGVEELKYDRRFEIMLTAKYVAVAKGIQLFEDNS